jgi:TonB family protein
MVRPALALLGWLVALGAGAARAADPVVAPPSAPAGCVLEVRNQPDPKDLYPEKARRAEQQGMVVIEVGARVKWGAAVKPVVSGTSGFELLDKAALASVRNTQFRSDCPANRFRVAIRFRINP